MAELFCKVNKPGLVSANGLVGVVVPQPCLIGTFFALHLYFSDSVFDLSNQVEIRRHQVFYISSATNKIEIS